MRSTTSINDFCDRKLYRVSDREWDEILSYQKVDYREGIYDDPKYNWIMVIPESANDTKYGRWMVSKEFKLLRNQTMGEFYGTSAVD